MGIGADFGTEVFRRFASGWQGGSDIAWDVWVTQEQEGLPIEPTLNHLVWLCNPDAPSSVRANRPLHWRSSSARNYARLRGLIEVVIDWKSRGGQPERGQRVRSLDWVFRCGCLSQACIGTRVDSEFRCRIRQNSGER